MQALSSGERFLPTEMRGELSRYAAVARSNKKATWVGGFLKDQSIRQTPTGLGAYEATPEEMAHA